MAPKHVTTTNPATTRIPDDLSLIRGIGPAIAVRLHKAGILTYRELASMSPGTLAARVPRLSAAQVTRQDWIGQARKLSSPASVAKAHRKGATVPATRQHYENFAIEILLDDKNRVRRTRVVHVQSGDADTWAGWEPEQISNFLARHSGLRTSQKKPGIPSIDTTRTVTSHGMGDRPVSDTMTIPGPHATSLVEPTWKPAPVESVSTNDRMSKLHLRDLIVCLPDTDVPISFIQQGKPYRIRLSMEPDHVTVPPGSQAIYKAKIILKQVGGQFESVIEASGVLGLSGCTFLTITGEELHPGTYRLDAFVRLAIDMTQPPIHAFLEGNLLQVY